jgi:hypothetical protein
MKLAGKTALALRLERLRAATGKTWDALATDLGIKRAMLFHVLAGRRGFSEKTLRMLLTSEVEAGVRSKESAQIEEGLRGTDLVAALLHGDGACQSEVTIADIDKGTKDVSLEYRRGSPPPDYPTRLKVTAAANAAIWKVFLEKGMSEDASRFLAACLPDLKDRPDLLNRLTPSCYARIFDTALDLTFGMGWRAKLKPGQKARKHGPG